MQCHVLKHHGYLFHVLTQGLCQSLPDQAQVAGGGEEDAAVDAVVHQVVVRGFRADACTGRALVPVPRREHPRHPPPPPLSPDSLMLQTVEAEEPLEPLGKSLAVGTSQV